MAPTPEMISAAYYCHELSCGQSLNFRLLGSPGTWKKDDSSEEEKARPVSFTSLVGLPESCWTPDPLGSWVKGEENGAQNL